jgi:hypothetical protein
VLQWTVLPHKNVEIVGWVSLDEEKRSGKAAAMKLLGRESDKKCSLTGPKGMAKASASMVYHSFFLVPTLHPSYAGLHMTKRLCVLNKRLYVYVLMKR